MDGQLSWFFIKIFSLIHPFSRISPTQLSSLKAGIPPLQIASVKGTENAEFCFSQAFFPHFDVVIKDWRINWRNSASEICRWCILSFSHTRSSFRWSYNLRLFATLRWRKFCSWGFYLSWLHHWLIRGQIIFKIFLLFLWSTNLISFAEWFNLFQIFNKSLSVFFNSFSFEFAFEMSHVC